MPDRRVASLIALAALAFGFAIEMGPVGTVIGEAVAWAITRAAEPLLWLAGLDVVRQGTELRSDAGWAVRVSEVCDGMGLVVVLGALLAAFGLRRGRGWLLWRVLVGLLAIQVFNLFRVVSLTLALDGWPEVFGHLHDRLFPLLTVLLFAALLLPAARLAVFAALAVALTLLWTPLAGAVSALLVAPANLVLPVLSPSEVGAITQSAGTWSVGTQFLAGTDPLRLYRAPFEPRHFTLALPVILAAVLLARRPVWLIPAVVLMLMALCVAATVAVLNLGAGLSQPTVLLPQADGSFLASAYVAPEALLAGLRLLQNVLVHFLLLLLPFVVLDRREAAA